VNQLFTRKESPTTTIEVGVRREMKAAIEKALSNDSQNVIDHTYSVYM